MKKLPLAMITFSLVLFTACSDESSSSSGPSSNEVPSEVKSFMELDMNYTCSETENYCKITYVQEEQDTVQCTGKIWTSRLAGLPTVCDKPEGTSSEAIDPTSSDSQPEPASSETTIQTACVVPGVFSSCMYTTSADAKAFLDQECTNTLQGTIASDCTGFPNCTAADEGMFMCEQ
jgi:hypothetical protein